MPFLLYLFSLWCSIPMASEQSQRHCDGVYKPHVGPERVKGQQWAQVALPLQPCQVCSDWGQGWKGSNPAQKWVAGEEYRPTLNGAVEAPLREQDCLLSAVWTEVCVLFLSLFPLSGSRSWRKKGTVGSLIQGGNSERLLGGQMLLPILVPWVVARWSGWAWAPLPLPPLLGTC